jgi:hypothetical protein
MMTFLVFILVLVMTCELMATLAPSQVMVLFNHA